MESVGLHGFRSKMVGILPFHLTPFISRGRLKPTQQERGLQCPPQIQSPVFRVAGVIAAVLSGPMLRRVIA
jgi:hypothetical protein